MFPLAYPAWVVRDSAPVLAVALAEDHDDPDPDGIPALIYVLEDGYRVPAASASLFTSLRSAWHTALSRARWGTRGFYGPQDRAQGSRINLEAVMNASAHPKES
jgi:hypothetical protein